MNKRTAKASSTSCGLLAEVLLDDSRGCAFRVILSQNLADLGKARGRTHLDPSSIHVSQEATLLVGDTLYDFLHKDSLLLLGGSLIGVGIEGAERVEGLVAWMVSVLLCRSKEEHIVVADIKSGGWLFSEGREHCDVVLVV